MERAKRLEEDRIRMEAERENYVSDEEEEVTTQKKEITVNKLRVTDVIFNRPDFSTKLTWFQKVELFHQLV